MKFVPTEIIGAYIIQPERMVDERGFFARIWCEKEFGSHGLSTQIIQTNVSVSHEKGTLRGLHFQRAPFEEAKIVRCPRGAIFDVAVDLRPQSPSFKKWVGVELSEENGNMLYVPEGCAQGLLTLADDTEIYYHTSESYAPEAACGVRYNDPTFSIQWPDSVRVISEQDKNWPEYQA